jgi:tetratricopeptide (TPR) repeat protein
LSSFENLTGICWKLSQGNDLDTANRVLWAYLPKLVSLALPPSPQQPTAAKIVSQSYLLAASLAGHHNDLKARQTFSEQALLFGNVAQDRNLQIAALRQLAATFDYQGRPDKVLQTYEQALPYLNEVSPLLCARIYAGVSGIYAELGYEQESLRFLSLAYENFPEHPEIDPSFLFADCGYFTLVIWDGLAHFELHQFREAAGAFARIDGLQSNIQVPERVRAEILNHQAATFTELGDMDQACIYLEAAVQTSLRLGSERRYHESLGVFTQMKSIWSGEKQVKSLGDLFVV